MTKHEQPPTPAVGSLLDRPVGRLEPERCGCRACIERRGDTIGGFPRVLCEMVLCPTCGNKRCPHASYHLNECTGSNEPGQPGSVYA